MKDDNKWLEVSIKTNRQAEEALNNVLIEFGINGVVIREDDILNKYDVFEEPILVKCYLPYDNFLENTLDEMRIRILGLNDYGFSIKEDDMTFSILDEKNWLESWKEFFKPMSIGRVTIKPTWEEIETLKRDEILIELNPEMAFGTGLHPTTKACIKFVQSYMSFGDEVIDLGVGSGILSIACVKLGAKKVYAYDISPEACKVTAKNAELNGVGEQIEVYECDVIESSYPKVGFVLANLNSNVLFRLFKIINPFIKPGGYLIVSGIIISKRKEILTKAQNNGFIMEDEKIEKEWLTLVLKRN